MKKCFGSPEKFTNHRKGDASQMCTNRETSLQAFEELREWATTMKGKRLYYAKATTINGEAAIFQTERDRDTWVNESPAERIALTREQALKCVGSTLDIPYTWDTDTTNSRIYWAR